jgi:hypothetical protein
MIERYLMGTRNMGLIWKPQVGKGPECYSDADVACNWIMEEAENDAATAGSRRGYILMYANCPLLWGSKLQTEIDLSSTKSKYITLSQSL